MTLFAKLVGYRHVSSVSRLRRFLPELGVLVLELRDPLFELLDEGEECGVAAVSGAVLPFDLGFTDRADQVHHAALLSPVRPELIHGLPDDRALVAVELTRQFKAA